MEPRPAYLHFESNSGHVTQSCLVIGETKERYRVKPDGEARLRLPGYMGIIIPGQTALVPKKAIRFDVG